MYNKEAHERSAYKKRIQEAHTRSTYKKFIKEVQTCSKTCRVSQVSA